MSDDEQVMSEEEEAPAPKAEDEAPPSPTKKMAPPEDTGPSEAQLAMQKRRAAQKSFGSADLDEQAKELLEANKEERAKMEEEIEELRKRSVLRKTERVEEEKRLTKMRQEEDAKRKGEEDERKAKKDAEEASRREKRAERMAEFEKWKSPPQRNFVITKREDGSTGVENDDDSDTEGGAPKKSKEQLEAEKKAILSQRIPKCDTSGMDSSKLTEKAKELHTLVYRLEGEKYDLEKRFHAQQYDMQELAERARQMNKVGKDGSLKRINIGMDEVDEVQVRFAGAPSKVEMYSKYERQKDKRSYGNRKNIFTGPQYGYPADKIAKTRSVIWDENTGLPSYSEEEVPAEAPAPAEAEAGEE